MTLYICAAVTMHDMWQLLLQIERIQNPSLYLKYMVHKQEVKKRCGESALIERSLWHGTSEDAVGSINTGGFNRSYCGKNGLCYTMYTVYNIIVRKVGKVWNW